MSRGVHVHRRAFYLPRDLAVIHLPSACVPSPSYRPTWISPNQGGTHGTQGRLVAGCGRAPPTLWGEPGTLGKRTGRRVRHCLSLGPSTSRATTVSLFVRTCVYSNVGPRTIERVVLLMTMAMAHTAMLLWASGRLAACASTLGRCSPAMLKSARTSSRAPCSSNRFAFHLLLVLLSDL